MARRPLPITYRQTIAAIRDAHLTIISVAAMQGMPPLAQEVLRLLADRLALVIARDNGRSR